MTIEPFTLEDIEFDLAELEPPDWDAMAARIRWHLSTPYALAIKSVFGEALVSGLGTAIAHGGTAWIGERLMHSRFRGEELESKLVAAMMEILAGRGCTTVSAIIEEDKQALFEKLGFSAVGEYVTYANGSCEAPTLDEVELFEPHHSMGVLRLDKLASGEDRRELISEHFYASRIFVSKGRVQGHYVPLLGEGLVIAENSIAGLELLRWHLGHVAEVTLPADNEAAIEFLQQRKYTEVRCTRRMVFGAPITWHPEMVYAWIGRTLG